MKNEVLCKFLAHNLCCVIQSQLELAIAADFWGDAVTVGPTQAGVQTAARIMEATARIVSRMIMCGA
jgi:hypothetical protein